MKNYTRPLGLLGVALVISLGALSGPIANASHIASVGLGTAHNFAVLAGSAITNVPTSSIGGGPGNVGLSPADGTFITGLTAAQVQGTIYAVANGPAGSTNDPALLTAAKTDLTAAYDNASPPARPGGIPVAGGQLGGLVLQHGVYADDNAPDSLQITGTLTLDAQGDRDAVWIFQSGSTLITAVGSTVTLINGAQACNVFWQVTSSATLGVNSTFVGTVLALTTITANTGATIHGRLLARNGAVNLDQNTITRPTCQAATQAPAATAAPTATPTASPSASPTPSPVPVATATPGPVATPAVTVAPAAGAPRTGSGITGLPSTSTDDLEMFPTWSLFLALAAFAPVVLLMRARERRAGTIPKS